VTIWFSESVSLGATGIAGILEFPDDLARNSKLTGAFPQPNS